MDIEVVVPRRSARWAGGPGGACGHRRRRPSAGLRPGGAGRRGDAPDPRRGGERHGFAGKVGQTLALRAAMPSGASDDAGEPEADVILVGVGDLTLHDGGAAPESLRRAVAAYVRAVGPGSVAALLLPAEPGVPDAQAASAVAEGAALAAYRYDDFRTGEQPEPLDRLVVVPAPSSDPSSVAAGLQWGARLAESVSLARTWSTSRPAP